MKQLIIVVLVVTLTITLQPRVLEEQLLPKEHKVRGVNTLTKHLPKDFKLPYLGVFKITAYTAGFESTGKTPNHPLYGVTATGSYVTPNHTIASDWGVLPAGTKVKIQGFNTVFTVEDRGGGVNGKHIDVYMKDLSKALKWGKRKRKVYLVQGGE